MLYRDNQGRGTRYPPHDGARFLVQLYRTGVTTEPDLFLCDASADDNREGALLKAGRIAPTACSYAGRRNRNQNVYPGIFTEVGAAGLGRGGLLDPLAN